VIKTKSLKDESNQLVMEGHIMVVFVTTIIQILLKDESNPLVKEKNDDYLLESLTFHIETAGQSGVHEYHIAMENKTL